jgi:hypothetical protein
MLAATARWLATSARLTALNWCASGKTLQVISNLSKQE